MPEGDTIFRTARTLHRALSGKLVERFASRYAQLSRIDDDAPLRGRRVLSVEARGKHCLMHFSGDLALRTHLRMNGSWHVYRPGEPWQRAASRMRIVVEVPDFVAVAFDVPVAEFETAASLARGPVAALGPDLLATNFDAEEALRRLRSIAARPIGEALLDQRALAGIGNVFKSEILFLAGVHPETRVGQLSADVLAESLAIARRLLLANVHDTAGAEIVTYGGLRRTTGRADPSARLWVYGRTGAPCRRCGTPLRCFRQGEDARVTFFCPHCQPAGLGREMAAAGPCG